MGDGIEDATERGQITVHLSRASAMQLPLRHHFGVYAGGLEHALALATLAHATRRNSFGRELLPSDDPAIFSLPDTESRLIALLENVLVESDCTIEDLRREGFSEPVLSALHATLPAPRRRAKATVTPPVARYGTALGILQDSLH